MKQATYNIGNEDYSENIIRHEDIDSVYDYNVRQIQPSDDERILQITRQAFEEYGAPQTGSVYCDPRMEHLSKEFERDDAEYWIVEDKQGNVLGGCGFYPTEGLPGGMAEMVILYCSPKLRGKGMGYICLHI